MPMRCDKACEILADKSARFFQFGRCSLPCRATLTRTVGYRKTRFVRDSRQGLRNVAECRKLPHSYGAMLRNRLLLPEEGIAPKIVQEGESACG